MDDKVITNDTKRYYGLDILKAAAIILIVFHHYQQIFNVYFVGKLNYFNGVFNFGYLVELFFVISGCLLQHSAERKGIPDFTTYFKSKYMRFFPMCFLSITFYCLMQWVYYALLHSFFFDNGIEAPIGIWNYFASISLFHTGWGIDLGLAANNPTWYISVLLFCYIIYWIASFLEKRVSLPANIVYAFMIFLGLHIQKQGLNNGFLNDPMSRGYVGFFTGVITYKLVKKYGQRFKWIGILTIVINVTLIIMLHEKQMFYRYFDNLYYIIVFLLFPMLVGIFMCSKWMNQLGNNRVISMLGNCSFEMLIWHLPLMLVFQLLINLINPAFVHTYTTMIVFTIVVELISMFTYQFVELKINEKIKKQKSE